MSKDLEDRVARLERAAGATGIDIHNFDSADQAAAHAKQLEADAKAGDKQAKADEKAKG